MSSAISTESLRPWQFFVLAALGCATAATFIARGQGVTTVILLSLLMGCAALVGLAALRALLPLVTADDDRTAMIGQRTRAALEREKTLALRAIKELEFDRAMGKLSEEDWKEMSGRLRTRAARLMRQLDAGAGYRAQIERDLAKKLEAADVPDPKGPAYVRRADPAAPPVCASCSTENDTDARFCKGCGQKLAAILCALCVLCGTAFAQFQMPDPKQMSGIPRPVDDLPARSISVRLIRGSLSNNIVKHPVDLHVGPTLLTVKTDDTGRAQFDNVPTGAIVKATADVDGEHLESQEFQAPAQGGIRLLLVATDKNAAPATEPNAPAVSGQVVLTSQSRLVFEPGDEVVNLFYLLDINNPARVPVNPPVPFAFDVPADAVGTGIMEGSSPQAKLTGHTITVLGPFPPGHTFVQVGTSLPAGTGSIALAQTFPANLESLAIVAQKSGDATLSSPQITNQREMPSNGETFIAATGGPVNAGQPISISLTGLPHHSRAPLLLALSLAVGIVLVGVWASSTPRTDPEQQGERKRLASRREKLLNDLARLESDRRHGRAPANDDRRYHARREELIAALERVYGALDGDDERAMPPEADPAVRAPRALGAH